MATIKGGHKRDWNDPKKYRAHLREMVAQDKGTNADGSWCSGGAIGSQSAHQHLVAGYRLGAYTRR